MLEFRQRLLDAIGAVRSVAHPKHVDGLKGTVGHPARVDLRGVDFELARHDGRGDRREQAGAILGHDAKTRSVRPVTGHHAKFGHFRMARGNERRAHR